jgi:uncharacterized surface anchored protein
MFFSSELQGGTPVVPYMKKIFAVLLACTLIFTLVVPVPAVAQDRDKEITGEARTEAKPKRKSYKGTIEAIDVAARTITVKKAASSKTFTVAPDAPNLEAIPKRTF